MCIVRVSMVQGRGLSHNIYQNTTRKLQSPKGFRSWVMNGANAATVAEYTANITPEHSLRPVQGQLYARRQADSVAKRFVGLGGYESEAY